MVASNYAEVSTMKVAVVGAAGFVGRALVKRLADEGLDVLPIVRSTSGLVGELAAGDIGSKVEWTTVLRDQDAVVHLAARVHVTTESEADPVRAFRRVNAEATLALAEGAAASGVRRFLFMSTIGVNGESSRPGEPFMAIDAPNPSAPYAQSKWEAEQSLMPLRGRMEIVMVRPPLIYGTGAKGRFATLVNLVRRGIPLPLALVRNSRSFAGIDNVVDFLLLCLTHPGAADEVFLVADEERVSTAAFVRMLGRQIGRQPLLLPVPPMLMMAGATLIGKRSAGLGLLGTLEIDLAKNLEVLGWRPPVGLDEGLARAARSPPEA